MSFNHTLVSQIRIRIIEESIPRIKKCLTVLTEKQIWYKANDNTNSVGNLIIHLCGNARQWIISGLDHQPDERDRDYEFNEKGPIPKKVLINMLDILIVDLDDALGRIVETDLLKNHTIQKHFKENGVSIIVHAIEHFSYHTGQITYYTKLVNNIDTGYYADLDL